MKPYEKLEAWKRCHALALAVHHASRAMPPIERYDLARQMRRAAFSAAANIAEGVVKKGQREFRRFLDVSLGSLSELSYALLYAKDLDMMDTETFHRLDTLHEEASKMTWGLYRSITNRNQRDKRL